MRLDAEKILGAIPDDPWARQSSAQVKFAIRVVVEAFNAAIDSALYSLDPTALERLGTLIAEHALRVRPPIERPSEMPEPPLHTGERVSELERRLARAEMLIEELVERDPRIARSAREIEADYRRRILPGRIEVPELAPSMSMLKEDL